jgi:threonylcarbamoyladenosine tRNA methylthiotransferase MtaB
MGRRYDTALYTEKLEKVRRAMERPGEAKVFFGIDVMAGLPGETDALFEEGLAFIRSVRPAFIHVFPYSRRPGTPAASMKGQVSEPVKAERVKRLEGLCSELHTEFVEAHRGQKAQVLFESKEKNGMMGGYTGNYIRVSRPYEAALVGFISEVTL